MRSWVCMIATALCLTVLIGGCSKTTETPTENTPQGKPENVKIRKGGRPLPPQPEPIKLPPP